MVGGRGKGNYIGFGDISQTLKNKKDPTKAK